MSVSAGAASPTVSVTDGESSAPTATLGGRKEWTRNDDASARARRVRQRTSAAAAAATPMAMAASMRRDIAVSAIGLRREFEV